jgi:hypothetical protein
MRKKYEGFGFPCPVQLSSELLSLTNLLKTTESSRVLPDKSDDEIDAIFIKGRLPTTCKPA